MSRFGDLDTQYLDDAANPLAFGKIAFQESDTDDDKDTFADLAETPALVNPNPLILNADGTQPNCFFTGIAKGILFDSEDNQIRVLDPIGTTETSTVFPLHNTLTVYTLGNVVSGSDDLIYQLIVNTSTGQDPTVTPTAWSQRKFVGVFNINETYAAGDIVQASDKLLYVALLAQSGNTPVGDTTNWKPASSISVFVQTVDGQDNTLKKTNLLDYGEITNAIGSIGGGTQDINIELGNSVSATVDTSATTFTFSNPTASDELCGFVLILTNGGSQTITWPATVDWPGGLAPTLTSSGLDKLVFETNDGGTTWLGNLVALAYA